MASTVLLNLTIHDVISTTKDFEIVELSRNDRKNLLDLLKIDLNLLYDNGNAYLTARAVSIYENYVLPFHLNQVRIILQKEFLSGRYNNDGVSDLIDYEIYQLMKRVSSPHVLIDGIQPFDAYLRDVFNNKGVVCHYLLCEENSNPAMIYPRLY